MRDFCESCEFPFIYGYYVSILIQKNLKGSLQSKLKGASVWPFNARSISAYMLGGGKVRGGKMRGTGAR